MSEKISPKLIGAMQAVQHNVCILIGTVVVVFLMTTTTAGQVGHLEACQGRYKDGSKPTDEELSKIIKDHLKWLQAGEKEDDHRRANLCGANLTSKQLSGAKLRKADLRGANLDKANLSGENTDLSKAELDSAYLREANLSWANMQKVSLSGADLSEANLEGTDLRGADLKGAYLRYAKLTEVNLNGADLSGRANLGQAKLIGADLREAKLNNAHLGRADLSGAELFQADLNYADLSYVNLDSAVFELKPGSLPDIQSFMLTKNLSQVKYWNTPYAMLQLREAFKKAGMRKQEREITFAIKRGERLRSGPIESTLSFIFLELTCAYGMSPLRPLKILCLLILFFSLLYMIALIKRGRGGIWAVWLTDRVHKREGEEKPVRVTDNFLFPRSWFTRINWKPLGYMLRIAIIGIYFSLLSAFRIGWRELNVGDWFTRLQPREYILQATGWVRFVSGLQSLISVYLLALWVLTYFGRPFE